MCGDCGDVNAVFRKNRTQTIQRQLVCRTCFRTQFQIQTYDVPVDLDKCFIHAGNGRNRPCQSTQSPHTGGACARIIIPFFPFTRVPAEKIAGQWIERYIWQDNETYVRIIPPSLPLGTRSSRESRPEQFSALAGHVCQVAESPRT